MAESKTARMARLNDETMVAAGWATEPPTEYLRIERRETIGEVPIGGDGPPAVEEAFRIAGGYFIHETQDRTASKGYAATLEFRLGGYLFTAHCEDLGAS